MTRLAVLRSEPGASDTVRKARRRGLDAISLSLFQVEPVAWEVPDIDHFDALLLTSANAVLHGGAVWTGSSLCRFMRSAQLQLKQRARLALILS